MIPLCTLPNNALKYQHFLPVPYPSNLEA